MTIQQLGNLIQAIVPQLVETGNSCSNLNQLPNTYDSEQLDDLAADLTRIANEIQSYADKLSVDSLYPNKQ